MADRKFRKGDCVLRPPIAGRLSHDPRLTKISYGPDVVSLIVGRRRWRGESLYLLHDTEDVLWSSRYFRPVPDDFEHWAIAIRLKKLHNG